MRYTSVAKKIRKSIAEKPFPPKFPDDEWTYSSIINITNCFAYAINSTVEVDDVYFIIKEEKVHIHDPSYSDQEVCDAFEAIMQYLGIEYCRTKKDGRRPNHSYRIAVCNYVRGRDFHFARQNKNGSWSHKMGWYSLPTLISKSTENFEEKMEQMGYKVVAFYAIKQLKL